MTSTRTRTGLRTIAESFVVAPPSGASTRTRLHPTAAEADGLRQVGMYLGSRYRSDVVARSKIGVVPAKLNGRADRKRELTADTSSRWAGTITRAAEDQYQLGLRALTAEIVSLTSAIRKLRQRLAVPVCTKDADGTAGYRSRTEHGAKTIRLRALETRLRDAETKRRRGSPTIVLGGGRLWGARQNLAAAGMTEAGWRARWDAARMFLTADGESTQVGGNLTIRVNSDGFVQVKVPGALESELGSHLQLAVPVAFALRGEEWADRVHTRQAIRYDITFDPDKDRWYLDASWGYGKVPAPPIATLRAGRVIGVDLNVDHLAAAVIDPAGNPVGTPAIIPLIVDGLSAGARDGHLRHAITTLLEHAVTAGATAIAIENLNFSDARATGKETMGRGGRGKRFRRQVAGIPTGKFRERLTAMAANRGIYIIAVDPAYTSRWGGQHWTKPLQQRTSGSTVTRHQAAAVAIGRRAHGHRIKRRKDGDRTQQRMRPTPPPTSAMMKPVNTPTALTGPPRRQPPKLTG